MKIFKYIFSLMIASIISISFSAQSETTIYATHDSTSGSYVDYMKTVYARAGKPEIMMLSLTSFDKEFELNVLQLRVGHSLKMV